MAIRIVEELRRLTRQADALSETVYGVIRSGQWGLDQDQQPISHKFVSTYYEVWE